MNYFFVLLALVSFSAQGGISVISDLDDTIKITNAGSNTQAAYNGIFTARVFTGMPEFLQESRAYVNELHILTASPAIVGPRIRALLGNHEIDFDSYIMRRTFGTVNKFTYKVNAIKGLLSQLPEDDFILIGDDVDTDPEVFDTVMKLYPERILSAYVKVVSHRQLPDNLRSFFTSFDLALYEHEAGRMDQTGVHVIAELLLQDQRTYNVFPVFAHCPVDPETWRWQYDTVFVSEAWALAEKFTAYCRDQHLPQK